MNGLLRAALVAVCVCFHTLDARAEPPVTDVAPPRAASAVFPLLDDLKDPEVSVRVSAAMTLRELGAVAWPAIPALIEALEDPDVGVRKSAAGALGGMGPAAADAVPALADALADPHRFVRSWAAMALFEIGPPAQRATPHLLRLLESDTANLRGRAWSASALPAIGADADVAVPGLLRALETDESEEVRAVAVLSLEHYGQEASQRGATPGLIDALQDPAWKVRGNAACAFAAMSGEETAAAHAGLARALGDATPYVRGCAARSLGALGATAYLDPLGALLVDDDAHVRHQARRALELLAPPQRGVAPE